MKFSDIPSHEQAKQLMRKMVADNRLPHALLLEGPQGIGKLALARAFAQYIHCENPDPDGDACGVCQNCRLHQAMNHIDTYHVFPVVKPEGASTPPVSDDFLDSWREFIDNRRFTDFDEWTATFDKKNAQPITYVTESNSLIHKLSFTSHVANQKIIIWWLPEKMNDEAANKLLKVLEEPLEGTIFIMVSNEPLAILPTIYSRVQRIALKRLPDSVIAEELQAAHRMSPADAVALAHLADGDMTVALRSVNSRKEHSDFLELFMTLMRQAYQRNVANLRDWANDLAAAGREREVRFYDYAIRMIRENFMLNFATPGLNYLNSAEHDFSRRFARFITERNVEKLIEVFDKARIDIAGNGNGKIINLDVAVKVILLLKQ